MWVSVDATCWEMARRVGTWKWLLGRASAVEKKRGIGRLRVRLLDLFVGRSAW